MSVKEIALEQAATVVEERQRQLAMQFGRDLAELERARQQVSYPNSPHEILGRHRKYVTFAALRLLFMYWPDFLRKFESHMAKYE